MSARPLELEPAVPRNRLTASIGSVSADRLSSLKLSTIVLNCERTSGKMRLTGGIVAMYIVPHRIHAKSAQVPVSATFHHFLLLSHQHRPAKKNARTKPFSTANRKSSRPMDGKMLCFALVSGM